MPEIIADNIKFIFTIAGSFLTGVVIPLLILLSRLGKRRKEINALKAEVTKLRAVSDTLNLVSKDLEEIKLKEDYSGAVRQAVYQAMEKPLNEMRQMCVGVNHQSSVLHDSILAVKDGLEVIAREGNYGDAVSKLAIAPSKTTLYKKDQKISNLEQRLREIKGDEAEQIIVECEIE